MTEIRAEDLRFSEGEVDLFLNGVMGLALSKADITAIESRTEGWAAGLQLAAIAMQNRAAPSVFITHLSGSHRYILGYLTEEVLSRQTEDVQLFLLQTAILNKLCGEVCDEVTGRLDSRALLEKCFHANLFLIPLDDEGRWYRYHHLFRDLLLNQQSRIPKQDILELNRRASRWYEGSGMIAESIEHALVAADYRHAVQLLEDYARGMIRRSAEHTPAEVAPQVEVLELDAGTFLEIPRQEGQFDRGPLTQGIEQGTHAELIAKQRMYYDLYRTGFKE